MLHRGMGEDSAADGLCRFGMGDENFMHPGILFAVQVLLDCVGSRPTADSKRDTEKKIPTQMKQLEMAVISQRG